MHSLFRVALLAVDAASIHLNSEKVKHKMRKKIKIFRVLRLTIAGT